MVIRAWSRTCGPRSASRRRRREIAVRCQASLRLRIISAGSGCGGLARPDRAARTRRVCAAVRDAGGVTSQGKPSGLADHRTCPAPRGAPGRGPPGSVTMGSMRLPVMPPVPPMLAKPVKQIPGGAMSYEPKWDGFRSIIFRDHDDVEIGSRNEKPMTRYFPELVEAARANLPERCVIDGEIIVIGSTGDRLDFERAAATHPPRGQPGEDAVAADPGPLRGVRPAGARRHRLHRAALRRAAGRARGRAFRRGAAHSCHRGHDRRSGGRAVVPPVRGRRARRPHRQADRRFVRAGQADHVQGQARTHRRLRGGRLPAAQERRGPDRIAAPRSLQRRRHAWPAWA